VKKSQTRILHARAVRLGKKVKARLVQLEVVQRKLLDRLTEEDKDAVIRVWREAMQAELHVYDMATKQFVSFPDHKTRLAASALAASYLEGLPVQRVIATQVKNETWEQKLELAKKSPEMLKLLLAGAVIDQAEFDRCMAEITGTKTTSR